MTPTGMPPRSWASLLGFLETELAIAVEAMARRLALVMNDAPHPHPGPGKPDGFSGIVRRGDLDRLLLSEWMLADEEPDEFIRRFAMSELSYLRRETIEPRSSTRLVVLMDAGPDQLGAPRLVYLAGLVVLHRRAEALGIELALGLLGQEPGSFLTGELPEQFALWRRSRSPVRPTADHLAAWLDCVEPRDHGWIFGADPALAQAATAGLGHDLRRLSARELDWTSVGVTSVGVDVDGRHLHLPLPDAADAVALLRGRGHRRLPEVSIGHGRSVRFPRFTGHARRLLSRGDGPSELVAISLPQGRAEARRPRRHHINGRILAAAVVGPRTVALVAEERSIRVAVIGRRLGRLGSIELQPGQLELDEAAIASITDSELEPLFFAPASQLIVRLAGQWWMIEPPDTVRKWGFVAVAASSTAIDRPRIAHLVADRIRLYWGGRLDLSPGRRVFFGPLDATAFESADDEFTITGEWGDPRTIRVPSDGLVIGVTATPDEGPSMVVQSPGERIIRLVGPESSRTLTMASGDVVDVSLHPTQPILAIQRRDGTVEAFALPDGTPLTVILVDDT